MRLGERSRSLSDCSFTKCDVIRSFALKLRPDFLRSIEPEIPNTLYASKPTILQFDGYFRISYFVHFSASAMFDETK